MIPVTRLFLINEVGPLIGPPFRNSIMSTAGPAIQTGRSQLTSDQKIKNSEQIQNRLTPKPKPVDLGFKRTQQYLHPANLP